MKDFNNIEEYPIPEGLEFKESYMQDAFALYDAEKQKRKRRLLIWWIISSTGFATVLLAGIYFFTKGPSSDADNKRPLAENKVSVGRESNTKTSPAITTKGILNGKQSVETNAVKKPFETNEKTGKSSIKSKTRNASTGVGISSVQNSKTKSKFTKSFKTNNQSRLTKRALPKYTPKANVNATHVSNSPGLVVVPGTSAGIGSNTPGASTSNGQRGTEITGKPLRDSLLQIGFTDLSSKPAQLAYSRDTNITPIKIPNSPHPADSDFRKHQVYINLGVNTLFGMKELQNRVTFRESIGVSYNYQINPKFAIGAGLEYHSISRISYKRKVGDTTNSDNTTTILNKTTLNYISLLPQASFQLGAKHKLTAGLGIEYLLKDPGERYEIQNYTSESNSRTNSKLYYSTFNRFNFSASIGYSYQFSRFMSVHALYHFGFTDITKNNTFNNTFDRNSRLQLMLKIKLY